MLENIKHTYNPIWKNMPEVKTTWGTYFRSQPLLLLNASYKSDPSSKVIGHTNMVKSCREAVCANIGGIYRDHTNPVFQDIIQTKQPLTWSVKNAFTGDSTTIKGVNGILPAFTTIGVSSPANIPEDEFVRIASKVLATFFRVWYRDDELKEFYQLVPLGSYVPSNYYGVYNTRYPTEIVVPSRFLKSPALVSLFLGLLRNISLLSPIPKVMKDLDSVAEWQATLDMLNGDTELAQKAALKYAAIFAPWWDSDHSPIHQGNLDMVNKVIMSKNPPVFHYPENPGDIYRTGTHGDHYFYLGFGRTIRGVSSLVDNMKITDGRW